MKNSTILCLLLTLAWSLLPVSAEAPVVVAQHDQGPIIQPAGDVAPVDDVEVYNFSPCFRLIPMLRENAYFNYRAALGEYVTGEITRDEFDCAYWTWQHLNFYSHICRGNDNFRDLYDEAQANAVHFCN